MLCWRFQALYNIGSHLPFYQWALAIYSPTLHLQTGQPDLHTKSSRPLRLPISLLLYYLFFIIRFWFHVLLFHCNVPRAEAVHHRDVNGNRPSRLCCPSRCQLTGSHSRKRSSMLTVRSIHMYCIPDLWSRYQSYLPSSYVSCRVKE